MEDVMRTLRCRWCEGEFEYSGRGRPPVTCGDEECLRLAGAERARLAAGRAWEEAHQEELASLRVQAREAMAERLVREMGRCGWLNIEVVGDGTLLRKAIVENMTTVSVQVPELLRLMADSMEATT
jgi:hypothetical protein